MGKRRAVKRFIDPKKDVCLKFVDNQDEEDDTGHFNELPTAKIQTAEKTKKVSFELKPEPEDLTRYGIYFNDGYNYLKHLKERDSFNWADNKELSLAPKAHPQQNKKDRRAEKKLKRNESEIPAEECTYYVPPVEKCLIGVDTAVAFDEDDDDCDLFSDTEFVDELPDNLIDILDGAVATDEFCPDFKYDEDAMEEEESNKYNFMSEGEVDYSNMPPLEELEPESDEDSRSHASNDCMDVSSGEDSDDDEEKEEKGESLSTFHLDDDNFPSLQATKNVKVPAPKSSKNGQVAHEFPSNPHKSLVMSLKDFQKVSDTAIDRFFDAVPSNSELVGKPMTVSLKKFNEAVHGDVDSFFDAVGHQPDEEGGYHDPEAECPMSGLPSSRTASKVVPEKVDMLNEHFNAMMLREFKRSDLCGDGLDDAEGGLDEKCPQFRAAVAADVRSGFVRPRDQIVHLVGPNAMRETDEEKALKNKAIEFTKNWKQTKSKLVEVAIPDPRAMKYNITNLPVVRNKNMPTLITLDDIPSYLRFTKKKKKKEGLTIEDIKAHDREMNAPKSNAEEDAQTFKTMLTELSYRPPDESSADRRERKTALKELRRGRREEKKQNQIAHKEMVLQTSKVVMNARHCRNIAVV